VILKDIVFAAYCLFALVVIVYGVRTIINILRDK
jgi:hypothetical protein